MNNRYDVFLFESQDSLHINTTEARNFSGKDLKASSGTLHPSFFSALLTTLPSSWSVASTGRAVSSPKGG